MFDRVRNAWKLSIGVESALITHNRLRLPSNKSPPRRSPHRSGDAYAFSFEAQWCLFQQKTGHPVDGLRYSFRGSDLHLIMDRLVDCIDFLDLQYTYRIEV